MWARPSFSLAEEAVGVHDDGALVGYAEVPHPKRADVCVDPGHRGRGIGAALMAAILAEARSRELSHVTVHSGRRAVDFYLRNGFSHHRQILLWEPAGR